MEKYRALEMETDRAFSQDRSQSLCICSNDLGPMEWIKKTKQTSNEMYGRHEETNRGPMDQNSEEIDFISGRTSA